MLTGIRSGGGGGGGGGQGGLRLSLGHCQFFFGQEAQDSGNSTWETKHYKKNFNSSHIIGLLKQLSQL